MRERDSVCVCVCGRACVRARSGACVRACVFDTNPSVTVMCPGELCSY